MSRTIAVLPLLLATVGLSPAAEVAARSGADACAASAATLGAARAAYAERCALPRVDCDPVNGGWTCSSARIGSGAPDRPAAANASVPKPDAVAPSAPSVEPRGGTCAVTATSISAAKDLYSDRCSAPRVDCDPVGGLWTCASYRIGLGAPGRAPVPSRGDVSAAPAAPTPAPTTSARSGALIVEAETVALAGPWRLTGEGIVYDGPNRYRESQRDDDANLAYRLTVPSAGRYRFLMRSRATRGGEEPPNDVWVRFGGVPWTKVFTPKPAQAWSTRAIGERDGRRSEALVESALPAGPVTVTISGRSSGHEIDWIGLVRVGGPSTSTLASEVYGPGDFLSLHHDVFPDPDDFQALVANRVLLDTRPDVEFVAVVGTIGHARRQTLEGAATFARSLFGDDVIDAKPGRLQGTTNYSDDAVTRVAALWQATLAAGDTVHVAEGGTGDFTALVLERLGARGVGNLERVRIVQHSVANETNTRADRLSLARRVATYVKIDDGNRPNGTPDFLDNDGAADRFIERARTTRYEAEWRIAFEALRERGRAVDFSDTVELMHVLGIPTSDAPDVAGFAARYF